MKIICKYALILCVTSLFAVNSLNAQESMSPLVAFDSFFHIAAYDSAYYYVNKAIEIYENNTDSLIDAYFDKNLIIAQTKNTPEALAFNREVEKLIVDNLDSSDHRFHYFLYTKGHYLSNDYQYDEAMDVFDDFLELCRNGCDKGNATISVFIDRAGIYNQRKQYELGIEACKQALTLLDLKGDSLNVKYCNLFNEISYGYLIVSQLDSAKYYAEQNIKKISEIFPPNHINLTMPYNILGAVEMDMQNYESSYQYFKKLEDLLYQKYLETGNSRNLGFAVSNMGSLFERTGEIGMAYEYAKKALKYSKLSYGKYVSVNGIDFINLAGYASDLGNLSEALMWMDTAYIVINKEDPGNKGLLAQLDYTMAHILVRTKPEEAIKFASRSVDYHVKSGSKYTLPGMSSFYELSRAKAANGDFQMALTSADQALAIADSIFGPLHQNAVQMFDQRLSVFLETKDIKAFTAELNQLLKRFNTDFENLDLPPYRANLQLFRTMSQYLKENTCDGHFSQNDITRFKLAFENFYERCVLGFNSTFTLLDNAPLIHDIYVNILEASLCSSEIDHTLIFEIIDNTKSQLLRLSTNHILTSNQIDIPQHLKERENYFKTKVKVAAIAFGDEENDIGEIIKYVEDLKSYNTFQDSLAGIYKEYKRKLKPDYQIDEKLIHTVTKKNECILNYLENDTALYLAYSVGELLKFEKLDGTLFSDQAFDKLSSGISTDDQGQLYNKLIPKTVQQDGCDLIIIGDGRLGAISFDMLKDETGKYLIENKNIRYAQSISVLKNQDELAESKLNSNNIFSLVPGFSEELKSSYLREQEGNRDTLYLNMLQQPFMLSLSEGLQNINRSKFLQGEEACEMNFNNEDLDFQILHFGTHGIFDDQSPLFSKLVLAKDSLNDGYLHAYEILEQEINAKLAILSACKTGSGKFHEGEGMLSLTYAFTYAGCPAVVLSLWNIDEKVTADILKIFYENLQKGERKSVALRNAKLSFLNSAPVELKDPYYWAGLVMIGNDDPLSFKKPGYVRYGVPLISILAVGLLIFMLRAKHNTFRNL